MFTKQLNTNIVFTKEMAEEHIQRRKDAGYVSIEDFTKFIGFRKLYLFFRNGEKSQYLYTFENDLDRLLSKYKFTGKYITSSLFGEVPEFILK